VQARLLILSAALFAQVVGCSSTPEAVFEDVKAAPELYEQGQRELEGNLLLGVYRRVDYTRAIEIFQSIIDNYPYSEYAVEAELRIADAYFEDGQFEEALSYYRDFADLHPEHPKVPYTIYRSALCHEAQIEGIARDQTATRNALAFLDTLLVRYPHSEHAQEAEPLWRELQVHLAESDEAVADFYRSRDEYEAAAERYRALLNDHPGLGLDARVLFKLGECYRELRRDDEADRIFRTLVAHYRESPFAFEAQRQLAPNLGR
jgi:outer membrane protein assembly factor BamD